MSYDLYRRANESIAQGSLTNSKRAECFIKGVYPTHVTHGQGPYVFDKDKKKYLDFVCALGTSIFGYADPYIAKAIESQLSKGWLFSLGSELEIEAAEKVKDHFPFVNKVRFLKSGTEACMAAVRIALAHTGRKKVLSSAYHGWSDSFVSLTPPSIGIPEQSHIQSFTSLDQLKTDVACLIIEPIVTDASEKRIEWLRLVADKCRKNGILLIFDEIITGFRWPKFSFSNDSGIRPDIICLGKACASGMPLSIVGLGRGIGDESEWFVSGSYHGELLSLAALMKTFDLMLNKYKIKDLWEQGGYFIEEFNEMYPEKLKIEGYPTRGVFVGDPLVKALFWQESARAGILFGSSWFFNHSHIEHRKSVLSTCADILKRIKMNEVKLTGEMPITPFSQRVRS